MAAALQNEMKDNMTVEATTTLAAVLRGGSLILDTDSSRRIPARGWLSNLAYEVS